MTSAEYSTQCPECTANLIQDHSKGECICERCGCVVMDQFEDYGRESNSTDYEEKAKNTRASGSTSFALHDYGLRTEIAYGTKDYAGKPIDYHMAETMNNVRKWHTRTRIFSPQQRRLSNVLTKINETCSAMLLPKLIVESAAMLYRNFESNFEAKGKSISCMAAATIFLACKKCSVVRSLDEIVEATGLTDQDRSSVKLASKYYRLMVMEMGVFSTPEAAAPGSQQPTRVPVMSLAVDQYISKLANMAKIDTKVERLAIDIAHKTNDHLLADGKAPNGLAAAYIYVASILLDINILQRDVSSLSGVTEVTIRNRCKDILTAFRLNLTVRPQVKSLQRN
ncbi:MAG TPA: transcription factor IIB [Nitrososphaera sp.]|nr:transcription factor IIB [Nitrososphaera sp.]